MLSRTNKAVTQRIIKLSLIRRSLFMVYIRCFIQHWPLRFNKLSRTLLLQTTITDY